MCIDPPLRLIVINRASALRCVSRCAAWKNTRMPRSDLLALNIANGRQLQSNSLQRYVIHITLTQVLKGLLFNQPKLLLFLDEPTSGLDSQSAWSIVSFLRSLADSGQAILCT